MFAANVKQLVLPVCERIPKIAENGEMLSASQHVADVFVIWKRRCEKQLRV